MRPFDTLDKNCDKEKHSQMINIPYRHQNVERALFKGRKVVEWNLKETKVLRVESCRDSESDHLHGLTNDEGEVQELV